MATEHTIYKNLIETEEYYLLEKERQVSVPWCVVHDAPLSVYSKTGTHCWAALRICNADSTHAPCDIRDDVAWRVVVNEVEAAP